MTTVRCALFDGLYSVQWIGQLSVQRRLLAGVQQQQWRILCPPGLLHQSVCQQQSPTLPLAEMLSRRLYISTRYRRPLQLSRHYSVCLFKKIDIFIALLRLDILKSVTILSVFQFQIFLLQILPPSTSDTVLAKSRDSLCRVIWLWHTSFTPPLADRLEGYSVRSNFDCLPVCLKKMMPAVFLPRDAL